MSELAARPTEGRELKETELYEPVKQYLESHGYEVRAEVNGCDVVAVKDEELVIIELKTSVNIKLLVQATDRQRMSDSVYVAVPMPGSRRSEWRGIQHVLRRLELGLITVNMDSPLKTVQVEFDPLPFQRRKIKRRRSAVIKEVADRSGDYNVAGSNRKKLVTAYRENAILIACCLKAGGAQKPADLRAKGTGPKTTSILSSNFYGWFQRVSRGVYELTDQGALEIDDYPEIVTRCETMLIQGEPK